MKNQIRALILACLLVACTPLSSSMPGPSPEPVSVPMEVGTLPASTQDPLYQALSLMPENANYVEFTDWMLIKEKEGLEGLSSTDELDKRMDFYKAIAGRYAIPSFYGRRWLEDHSQRWGWDSTDLEWEAVSSIISPPAFVLKFREDFDFKPVIAHLQERGFEKTIYQDIPIYSHEFDTPPDWIRTTELSIRNTAVIEEARMLVISGDYDMILAIIDAFQNKAHSLADDKSVQELIPSLMGTPGAFISGNVCSLLRPQALMDRLAFEPEKDTKQRQLRAQLDSRPQLENYEALGIGYSVDGPEPIGRIVLQFSDPEKALKDLKPRQELAQTGVTWGDHPQPYGDVFFSMTDDATVQGNQIVMEVRRARNRALGIFEMIRKLDVSFATCP